MYESFVLLCFIHQCHLMDDVCTDMLNLFKHYYAGRLWSFGSNGQLKSLPISLIKVSVIFITMFFRFR